MITRVLISDKEKRKVLKTNRFKQIFDSKDWNPIKTITNWKEESHIQNSSLISQRKNSNQFKDSLRMTLKASIQHGFMIFKISIIQDYQLFDTSLIKRLSKKPLKLFTWPKLLLEVMIWVIFQNSSKCLATPCQSTRTLNTCVPKKKSKVSSQKNNSLIFSLKLHSLRIGR